MKTNLVQITTHVPAGFENGMVVSISGERAYYRVEVVHSPRTVSLRQLGFREVAWWRIGCWWYRLRSWARWWLWDRWLS